MATNAFTFSVGHLNARHRREYLVLKKNVFHDEFGWDLPLNTLNTSVLWDAYDDSSLFAYCSGPNPSMCGVIRITPCSGDIPHRDLVEMAIPDRAMRKQSATLTCFAVKADLRGLPLVKCGVNKGRTIGTTILASSLTFLKHLHFRQVVLTTEIGALSKYFERFGFQMQGLPFLIQGRAQRYVNMLCSF